MSGGNQVGKVSLALLTMQRYSWEQGVAAQAFLESGDFETAILLSREAAYRQTADGRLAAMGDSRAVTDPAANGEALLYAAKTSREKKLEHAAREMAEYLLYRAPRSKEGVLYHMEDKAQIWVDSIYMAPPFLAVYGRREEALNQLNGMKDCLYDTKYKLYSHIWDEGSESFVRKDFWGVGNGWAAAGVLRVLKTLGNDFPAQKTQLLEHLRELIDSFLQYIREDFLFHNVLDEPSTFVETNAAQMLAYTIFRCLESEWIDADYLGIAVKIRAAVHRKVDGNGYVQGVCGAPEFIEAGTAPEGQAFFLLMEAAYQDLMKRNPIPGTQYGS